MHLGKKAVLAVVLLAGAAVAFHPIWMGAMGDFLVLNEPPRKSDGAVVLAGGWAGNRVLKGGELVRDGFAPVALVDGPPHHYGVHESELAIRYAASHGFPASYFEALPMNVNSTEEEARVVVQVTKRKGWKTVLLVTSNYHTRRALRIFKKYADGIEFRPVAAPDPYFAPHSWWKTRDGRRIAFLEWVKTVTGPFGI